MKKRFLILSCILLMLLCADALADEEFITHFKVKTVSNTSYRITWDTRDVPWTAEAYGLGWYDYSYFNPEGILDKVELKVPVAPADPSDPFSYSYLDTTAEAGIPRHYVLMAKIKGSWGIIGDAAWGIAQMPRVEEFNAGYMSGSLFSAVLSDYFNMKRATDMMGIQHECLTGIEAEFCANGQVVYTVDYMQMLGVYVDPLDYRLCQFMIPASLRGKALNLAIRIKGLKKDGSVIYSESTPSKTQVFPLALKDIDYTVSDHGDNVDLAMKWTKAYGADGYDIRIVTQDNQLIAEKTVTGNSITLNGIPKSDAKHLRLSVVSLYTSPDGTSVKRSLAYEEAFMNQNDEAPFGGCRAETEGGDIHVSWGKYTLNAEVYYRVRVLDQQGAVQKDSGFLSSPSYRISQAEVQAPVTFELLEYVGYSSGSQVWRETITWNPSPEIPEDPSEAVVSGGLYQLDSGKRTAVFIGPEDRNASSLSIPATVSAGDITYKVTAIGDGACKNMKKLTSLTIGKNVQKIGDSAFSGCTKLSKVSGGKKLVSIGARAFSNCSSLVSFTLYGKVTNIGAKAFYKCKKLKELIIKTKKLTEKTVGKDAFKTGKAMTCQCPKGKLDAYQKLLRKKGAHKKTQYR